MSPLVWPLSNLSLAPQTAARDDLRFGRYCPRRVFLRQSHRLYLQEATGRCLRRLYRGPFEAAGGAPTNFSHLTPPLSCLCITHLIAVVVLLNYCVLGGGGAGVLILWGIQVFTSFATDNRTKFVQEKTRDTHANGGQRESGQNSGWGGIRMVVYVYVGWCGETLTRRTSSATDSSLPASLPPSCARRQFPVVIDVDTVWLSPARCID